MDENTLSPAEVAKLLQCSTRHVIRLIKDGKLRAANIARPSSRRQRYRVTQDAVHRFLAVTSAPLPQPLRVPAGLVYAPVSQA
jgi:excisionase family DNA binding protein